MPSLVERMNKPIFIVSSGRSGSTILTWCLGQHPNIIPQEESDWLGPFAIDAAVGYERGTARSEWGQLSANFIQRDELLLRLGEAINGLILSHRAQFENTVLRERGGWSPRPSTSPAPKTSRNPDGRTALRNTLFISMGCANFSQKPVLVHLVRDVTDVVRSLLNFFPDGRNRL